MKRALAVGTAGFAALAALLVSGPSHASNTYELNMGSMAPRGTPWWDMLEQMKQKMEEESDGRIQVNLRPPGMYSETELVRETRSGRRIQGAGVTTGAIAEAGNVPQLQIVELPFLFNDNEEADLVLDQVLWDPMSEALARRGFILAAWSENGWRSFATQGDAIRSPDDLSALRMRSQESEVHQEMYDAYGSRAVQQPITQVLTSLQSNAIDGLDNTALFIQAGGLAEPLDYFTVTRHIYQPAAVIISRRWFEELPEDLQEIVREVRPIALQGRQGVRTEEAAMIENFPIFDVEVIELSDEERSAFAEKVQGIHEPFAASVEGGSEILQKINAALAEHRGE